MKIVLPEIPVPGMKGGHLYPGPAFSGPEKLQDLFRGNTGNIVIAFHITLGDKLLDLVDRYQRDITGEKQNMLVPVRTNDIIGEFSGLPVFGQGLEKSLPAVFRKASFLLHNDNIEPVECLLKPLLRAHHHNVLDFFAGYEHLDDMPDDGLARNIEQGLIPLEYLPGRLSISGSDNSVYSHASRMT